MRRKGQQAENDKIERITGLGRRTREEIAKWNQMTALRFQTGGRHQTSPASLRGLHKGKTYKHLNIMNSNFSHQGHPKTVELITVHSRLFYT